MMIETYLTQLKRQLLRKFPQDTSKPPDDVGDFLDLTVMRLLMDIDILPLKPWLEKYRRELPLPEKPVAEFYRLSRLSAVEELFGENGQNIARKAFEMLPIVARQPLFNTDAALVAQMAVGLSMLLADEAAISLWREKRLQMDVFEGWETSSFEAVYLSGGQAQADEFETIAAAAARVCVNTFKIGGHDSIAPLVLILGVLSKRKNKTLSEALAGRILKLEQAVFSNGSPKIEIVGKPPAYRSVKHKQFLEISANAQGIGELTTGNYEIAPFTTRLAPVLIKEYQRSEKNRAVKEILTRPDREIQCSLKLNSGVGMSGEEISNLERRMHVGFEWASHLTGGLRAEIKLLVVQFSGNGKIK